MPASNVRLIAAATLLCLLSMLSASAKAQITVGGDPGEVSPADPATWTSGAYATIGINSGKTGMISVAGGSSLSSGSTIFAERLGSNGTAIISGAGTTWMISESLYVGDSGTGKLMVENGGKVSGTNALIAARDSRSTGIVTVTGDGSALVSSGTLFVGYSGTGTLRVENGGTVTSSMGWIADYGAGDAVVTGEGSIWTINGLLRLGPGGGPGRSGTVTIGNGGRVTAIYVEVYGIPSVPSTVNLHINGNGMLVLGGLMNSYKVNLYADAFLDPGMTYSPITAYPGKTITWSGSGSYNAYGGTWSATAHTFSVATATASGAGVSNALTTGERLLITDSASGKRVGASFGTLAAGTNFQADLLGDSSLTGLMALLPADQTALAGWNFTTNFAGDQALLSFEVGAGLSDLSVWHYDGTTWTSFAAPDLTYGDDGIANFAVTSFSGYALTVAKHPGDANNDGAVDVVDLGILAHNYDTASGMDWTLGDFNKDGAVDVIDLGILARNYDWSAAPAGNIPEPMTMAMLALGGLAMLRRRR